MLLAWDQSLSVGDEMLDLEHQTLIDKINELHEAAKSGAMQSKLTDVVTFLAGYAAKHFADEEAYFDGHNYPDSAAHKLAHKAFTEKVDGVSAKIAAEGLSSMLAIEVSQFLADWIVTHIKGVDQKYAAWVAEGH